MQKIKFILACSLLLPTQAQSQTRSPDKDWLSGQFNRLAKDFQDSTIVYRFDDCTAHTDFMENGQPGVGSLGYELKAIETVYYEKTGNGYWLRVVPYSFRKTNNRYNYFFRTTDEKQMQAIKQLLEAHIVVCKQQRKIR